jgi:hypothetical protein
VRLALPRNPRSQTALAIAALSAAVLFFQDAASSGEYATFGLNDTAALDDGDMWPTSSAVRRLDDGGVEDRGSGSL